MLEKEDLVLAENDPVGLLLKARQSIVEIGVIERALRKALQVALGGVFEFADVYYQSPFKREILQKAFCSAASNQPWIALRNVSLHARKEDRAKIIETAVKSAAKSAPLAAAYFFPLYEKEPYADEVLKAAAQTCPQQILAIAELFFRRRTLQRRVQKIVGSVLKKTARR